MAKPDRIYASELLEREVMDLRAGEIVGAVTDFNVTREGVVTQLGVLPLQWYRGGKGIAPGAITNVTRERVSIEDSTLLDEFDPDGDTSLSAMLGDNLYGKQVLAGDGELLGTLADFAFDLSDGRITDLVVYGEEDKRSKISVDSIQTIGKSYVVINRGGSATEAPPGPKKAASSGSTAGAAAASTTSAKPVAPVAASEATSSAPRTTYYTNELAAKPAAEPEPLPPIGEEIEPAVAEEHALQQTKASTPAKSARKVPAPQAKPAPRTKAAPPAAKSATARKPRPETDTVTGRKPSPKADGALVAETQLDFGAEAEAAPLPAAAETLDGLGLSTFDRRKAEYLFGKSAHRDIRTASGDLILKRDAPFNRSRISVLMEAGMLNSVFLEMTQHKG